MGVKVTEGSVAAEPHRPAWTLHTLEWEDGPDAGQVVTFRDPTAAGKLEIAQAGERPPLGDALSGGEMADRVYLLFRACARSLAWWNLHAPESLGGAPIPATLDGLLSLDFADAVGITYAWLDVVSDGLTPDPSTADQLERDLALPVQALSG